MSDFPVDLVPIEPKFTTFPRTWQVEERDYNNRVTTLKRVFASYSVGGNFQQSEEHLSQLKNAVARTEASLYARSASLQSYMDLRTLSARLRSLLAGLRDDVERQNVKFEGPPTDSSITDAEILFLLKHASLCVIPAEQCPLGEMCSKYKSVYYHAHLHANEKPGTPACTKEGCHPKYVEIIKHFTSRQCARVDCPTCSLFYCINCISRHLDDIRSIRDMPDETKAIRERELDAGINACMDRLVYEICNKDLHKAKTYYKLTFEAPTQSDQFMPKLDEIFETRYADVSKPVLIECSEDRECSICLEDNLEILGVPVVCQHVFCFDCLKTNSSFRRNKCPLCKTEYRLIRKVDGKTTELISTHQFF